MLKRKLCGLLLAAVFLLLPVCAGSARPVPRLGQNGGAVAAAFGENFLFFDPADPTRLCVIDASDGSLAAWFLLDASSGAQEGLWLRTTEEYALIQTPKYAYRMNRALRVEARVPIPELPGQYSVSADLTHVVYQDLIHIEQMNLETGKTVRLLEGDYDAVPQEIYSSPSYLEGDACLLVFENTGAEDPVPCLYDLKTEELLPLGVTFDLDSSWKQCGDRLLVCGALVQRDAPDVQSAAPSPAMDYSAERVSGILDPANASFTALPLPLTGYGVQAMAANASAAFCFVDSDGGWTLYRFAENSGQRAGKESVHTEAVNLELLAVTARGRVLYRTFDAHPSGNAGNGTYFVG